MNLNLGDEKFFAIAFKNQQKVFRSFRSEYPISNNLSISDFRLTTPRRGVCNLDVTELGWRLGKKWEEYPDRALGRPIYNQNARSSPHPDTHSK